MKKIKLRVIACLTIWIVGSIFNQRLLAQDHTKDNIDSVAEDMHRANFVSKDIEPFYLHTQVKSMHLWRGLAVTNSWMVAMDGGVGTIDRKLRAGIWGGYSSNGEYKEFDYYAIYNPSKNLAFALWDIYNYSTYATWNNHSFLNYNADTTGHFLDLSASWTISDKLPLNLYWATVILGRDRTVKNNGNRYSTYVQATYPVLQRKNTNLSLFIGGSFALKPDKDSKAQFYGPKPGFNNIGFVLGRDLHIGTYTLPVSVTPSWNIIGQTGNVQLAFNVF
ncbi:hypothetical protein [Rhizosphaericola mali]|uniref:Uncharacterized protein n=1 Tax=Rhizosphaericola mali TaxID=2545455 RepID=A0A5P2GFS0_9BACT|nr:hypothetical protein [Rhizosphaericola mali]QES90481.1 hypothetical protein E0W69_018070 [Rhizosphaericola mali]